MKALHEYSRGDSWEIIMNTHLCHLLIVTVCCLLRGVLQLSERN